MKKKDDSMFKTLYVLSLAWQLGFMIVVPIVGFLLLGKWLDGYMGHGNVFLILGLILGLVITVYEVRDMFAPLISGDEDNTQIKWKHKESVKNRKK